MGRVKSFNFFDIFCCRIGFTFLESLTQSSVELQNDEARKWKLKPWSCDRVSPAGFTTVEEFPSHIKELMVRLQNEEEEERRQREIDRNTCKVSRKKGPIKATVIIIIIVASYIAFNFVNQ